MQSATTAPMTAEPAADPTIWTGCILSGLVVVFFLLDGAMKLVPLQPVVDTMTQLGWPTDPATLRVLGLVQITLTLLYANSRTSVLGAVLITAYLGGAVATHARIGSFLPTHTLFGVYVGVAAWAGLWLREPRLRALLPMKR